MKIAIISAMKKETKPLIDKMSDLKKTTYLDYDFYQGTLKGNEIIITFGGIGKVNTGIITTIINFLFPNLDLLINIGISGGVLGKVKPGDIVFSKRMAYSDVDVTQFGERYGQIPNLPAFFEGNFDFFKDVLHLGICGTILTADSFISDLDKINDIINKNFKDENICALDMESAAFAQCAYLYKIPFMAIRAISDVVGYENQIDNYKDYNMIACQKVCDVLIQILNK